jgi:hypothetical protein
MTMSSVIAEHLSIVDSHRLVSDKQFADGVGARYEVLCGHAVGADRLYRHPAIHAPPRLSLFYFGEPVARNKSRGPRRFQMTAIQPASPPKCS